MLAKINKITFLALIFLITNFSSQALAQDISENKSNSLEFNFDDEYQGEAANNSQNNNLVYDPFEKINRSTFAFNEALDKHVAIPIVKQYRRFVPNAVRKSTHNFVRNISTPFSIANSILQGDGQNSMASFSSFLINTTLGVGGLFDVAGAKNIKHNEEDLGQTLGKYGFSSGPYIVLPFLGPSNLRDFSGLVAEQMVNPLSLNGPDFGAQDILTDEVSLSITVIKAIDARDKLIEIVDDMRNNSFDLYATMRSAYLQRRQSLILNQ